MSSIPQKIRSRIQFARAYQSDEDDNDVEYLNISTGFPNNEVNSRNLVKIKAINFGGKK